MKKLYQVEMVVRVVIAANNEADAKLAMQRDRVEIIQDTDHPDIMVTRHLDTVEEVRTLEGWDEDCYPYGVPAVDRIKKFLNQP